MPALFPIIVIAAVFVFISAHAATHPPRRRGYYGEDYRSRGGSGSSRGGNSSRGGSFDRGGSRSGGRSESRSSRQYDRGRY